MKNVDLTKNEAEKLRKGWGEVLPSEKSQELKEYQTKVENLQKILSKLDESILEQDEEILLNKYRGKCASLFKNTTIPELEFERQLNQFKRVLVMFRDYDVGRIGRIIDFGRKIALHMKNSSEPNAVRLLSFRRATMEGVGIEESMVIWSAVFPGKPYDEIGEATSQEKYKDFRGRWWELQLEKWELLEVFAEASLVIHEESKGLKGAAAKKLDEFTKRLEEHWPKLKPAIIKTMEKQLFSDVFIEGRTVGRKFAHNVHNKYDGIPESTLKKWLDREDVRDKIRKAHQSETKAKPN